VSPGEKNGVSDRVSVVSKNINLISHPAFRTEADYLVSDEFQLLLPRFEIGGHALV